MDIDLSNSNQTEFTPPLEPIIDPNNEEMLFKYDHFPRKLDPALFQLDKLCCKPNLDGNSASALPTSKFFFRFSSKL